MKIKQFHRLTALLCAFLLVLTLSPSAFAMEGPLYSYNEGLDGNEKLISSYLYVNPKGGLTRFELIDEIDELLVEEYDSSYQRVSRQYLPDRVHFAGFYAGKDYNFVVYHGPGNSNEDDHVPALRVAKYSKDWKLLGSGELLGANTRAIYGSFRCAESNGLLFLHGAHTMYKADDGKSHQANMTAVFRISDMTAVDSFHGVGGMLYVSHSLNGWHVLADQDDHLVTFEVGDGYPRGIVVHRLKGYAASAVRPASQERVILMDIPGATGDNNTGVRAGGFAETRNYYVAAYSADSGLPNSTSEYGPRYCYLSFISKSDLSVKNVRLECPAGNSLPMLVPNGLDGGYVLWRHFPDDDYYSEKSSVYLASYSDGAVTSVKNLGVYGENILSDCRPVLYNGRLVWYTTHYSAPVFYGADTTGVHVLNASTTKPGTLGGSAAPTTTPSATPTTGGFTDVAANSPYKDAIEWAIKKGITKGTTATTFSPNAVCTEGQIVTFLYRAAGSPNKGSNEWDSVVNWTYDEYVPFYQRETPCTRANTVYYLWMALDQPPSDAEVSFTDLHIDASMMGAIRWAVEKGITTGTSPATFSPDTICTRGQIVTFLYRAMK